MTGDTIPLEIVLDLKAGRFGVKSSVPGWRGGGLCEWANNVLGKHEDLEFRFSEPT